MGKAKRHKLLRRAAKQMSEGEKVAAYTIDFGREGTPPVILKDGCRKKRYKQLKKDNARLEVPNANEEKTRK